MTECSIVTSSKKPDFCPTPNHRINLIYRATTFNIRPMYDMLTYWWYILIILVLAFVPGFAIATRIRSLNTLEQLTISFGISFLMTVLLTPLFAVNLDILARALFAAIIIISIYQIYKFRLDLKVDPSLLFIAVILIISLVSKFFIQTLWEYPVMGGDWYCHTLIRPHLFDMGDWTPPRDRTPLFNLLIYSYHKLLGTSLYQYWISQIVSVITNSVFIVPAYLIARNVFGNPVARVSTAFMIICPFLTYQTIYTWPKNLAMYFGLLMVYFLFFRERKSTGNTIIAGTSGALGFLTHNYIMFYILASVIALAYINKIHRKNPLISLKRFLKSSYIYYFVAMLIVVSPYLAWVYSGYGTVSTSRFIYYPFAVEGYDAALNGSTEELFETFYNTPVSQIIGIRFVNAVVTLTPAALPINPVATNFRTYDPIYYYSHGYAGGLSTLMYLLVVVWFVRYLFRKTKTDIVLVIIIAIPVILTLFMWGWREWGLTVQTLHPTVPILIMLGFNELYEFDLKHTDLFVYLIFAGCLVEDVIYAILVNRSYELGGGSADVAEGIVRYISDFQISDFTSAHFLLNTNLEFLSNFIISIAVIVIVIIYSYTRSSET